MQERERDSIVQIKQYVEDLKELKTKFSNILPVKSFKEELNGDHYKLRGQWFGGILSTFEELQVLGIIFSDEFKKRVEYMILKMRSEYKVYGYASRPNILEADEIIDEILKMTNEQIN